MTKKQQPPALLSRSGVLAVGTQAYASAIDRMDNRESLYALEAVREAQAGLDIITRQAVDMAREDGETWQEIANALGLKSRQAAEMRYG
jgi:DNA-directed RNA polymerase specialized sigma24 family protein